MKPAPPLTVQHEAAAQWHLRRQEASWSADDEAAFAAWRDADARHAQIYAQTEQTWLDLGAVPRPRLAGLDRSVPTPRPRWWAGLRLQWRPAVLAAGLVLAMASWLAYQYLPLYQLEVATGAELRKLALPDGSAVVVNRHSRLAVRLYAARREVELRQGEAFFEVSHNPERPFTVLNGTAEVRVVGTVFDVQAANPQLTVKVREGRVEVRPDARNRAQFTTLTANEALVLDDSPAGGRRFTVSTDMVGDWRSGQLVFRASPLASVAATLSHYLDAPVILDEPGLGSLPVSGYVATSAPGAFIESLPDLLAVKVRRTAQGGYRISAR